MKPKSYLVLMLAVLLSLSLLASCGGEVGDEKVLVFAMWSSPEGLFNENLSTSQYDSHSYAGIFSGLLRSAPDLSLNPDLAEEYEILNDGKTFYFKLRNDVYFHDGVKLTTKDVAFTFMWMMHPDYAGPRAENWAYIVGFDEYQAGERDDVPGIEIINDREIKFHLSQIDAPAFRDVATWSISPAHVFEDTPVADRPNHPAIQMPIGTGPFKFVEYVEGQYVVWERYDRYHGTKAKMDRIIVKVANQDVSQAELLTGSTDVAWISPNAQDFALYRGTKGMNLELEVKEFQGNVYQYMAFNMREDRLFGDKLLRKAAEVAIDRKGMIDGLMDGFGIVQPGHIASVSWAFDPNLIPKEYNKARAIQYLEEAGWTQIGSDGVRIKDGKKLEFTLTYPTGNPVRMESALLIQQNLQDVGFKVNLELLDFPSLSPKIFMEHDFDAYLMGWALGVDPDATSIFSAGVYYNPMGFDNERNEELLRAGRAVIDEDLRQPIYVEWQQLLAEELPYVWLYSMNEAYVYNSKLREFKPNAFNMWWDVELWHWAEDDAE